MKKRGSSIYRNRPPFSVFGVGDYSFAPWKVAISGFYKKLEFVVLGPVKGRPVVLDDTSYFLPCQTKEQAEYLTTLLNSPAARSFYKALIFWDSKRPITADLLRRWTCGNWPWNWARKKSSMPTMVNQETTPPRRRSLSNSAFGHESLEEKLVKTARGRWPPDWSAVPRSWKPFCSIAVFLPLAAALLPGKNAAQWRWRALAAALATLVPAAVLLAMLSAGGSKSSPRPTPLAGRRRRARRRPFPRRPGRPEPVALRPDRAADGRGRADQLGSHRRQQSLYYRLLLVLETGMLGVFVARDIILFYLFFEFTLVPLFFLIGIWGSHQRRYAAMKFFLFTLTGSVLTLLGLLAVVLWDYYHYLPRAARGDDLLDPRVDAAPGRAAHGRRAGSFGSSWRCLPASR